MSNFLKLLFLKFLLSRWNATKDSRELSELGEKELTFKDALRDVVLYYLYNSKNVKNTYDKVVLLAKFQHGNIITQGIPSLFLSAKFLSCS